MDFLTRLRKKIERTHSLYLVTFLFLLTFFAYVNTLGNGLFFDDQDFIYDNVYVKNFSVDKFFTQNAIAGVGKISNYYRPLQELSYAIEYQLFNGAAFMYHFDNLLLHAIAGMLLFAFIEKLTKNKIIALLTATLFLIHPVQTEAVSYASGRNDPIYVIFALLTFLFYLKNQRMYYLLSLITFFLSLLSKEAALIIPGLIMLIDFFQTQSVKKTRKHLALFLPYILIAGIYFLLRLTVLNFQDTLNFYGTETQYTTNIFVRLITFLSLLPEYMRFIFYPDILYIDRVADIVTTVDNTNVIVSIAAIVSLLFLSIKYKTKHPIFFFCFLWFFIAMIPVSGIIPINGLIYEHFLYFPSVGIFLAIAYLFYLLLTQVKNSLLSLGVLGIIGVIVLLLTIRTIVRNSDWKDPVTFYNQTIRHNPTSARLHNNLAMAYAEKNKNEEAIREYTLAIKLLDVYPQTHYNLGNSYVALNKLDEAEKEYRLALKIDPTFYRSYISLARIYKATNNKEEMEKLITEVELLSQKNPQFIPLLQTITSIKE